MMTKLFFISLMLFAGMAIMSSCSQEESISSLNNHSNDRISIAKKLTMENYEKWINRVSNEVEERGVSPSLPSEGTCNCYYRLHGLSVEYPELPSGLNQNNVQFIVYGSGQNPTCDYSSSNPNVQCGYFDGIYDPFYNPNMQDPCALGFTSVDCIDFFDFSGTGAAPFNCDVPLYSSFPVGFFSQWALLFPSGDDCSWGNLGSAEIALSIVCAYNGRVDETDNAGCDNIYVNQASENAIATISLTIPENGGFPQVSEILELEGCGCDPVFVE